MKTAVSKRRQLNLAADGRMALLTLWGNTSELNILHGVYTIKCVKPTNDLNGQRCFNSTPGENFQLVNDLLLKQIIVWVGRHKSDSLLAYLLIIEFFFYSLVGRQLIISLNFEMKFLITVNGKIIHDRGIFNIWPRAGHFCHSDTCRFITFIFQGPLPMTAYGLKDVMLRQCNMEPHSALHHHRT